MKGDLFTECNLDKEINQCQHFESRNCSCISHNVDCGMYNKDYATGRRYVRKERWYEKYYRKGHFYE